MGESMREDMVGDRIGEFVVAREAFAIGDVAAPRPQVQLVDRDRCVERDPFGPAVHPVAVAPLVVEVGDHRGDRRWLLGGRADGVGLLDHGAVGSGHSVQVGVADSSAIDPAGPHPGLGGAELTLVLPPVERSSHRNRSGVRRPHGEVGAAVGGLCTESAMQVAVGAFVEEIPVEVCRACGDVGGFGVHVGFLPRIESRRCTAGSASTSEVGRARRRAQRPGTTRPGRLCGRVSPIRSSRSTCTR